MKAAYGYIEMKKPQKTPKQFHCKKCGFTSRNKKDYTRHLSTTKHQMDNMDNIKSNEKNPRRVFECICGKVYKYNSGLSKHRKKCTLNSKEENIKNIEIATASSSTAVSAEMLNKLVEQNNTLMEKVIELSKDRQVINYQNCNVRMP